MNASSIEELCLNVNHHYGRPTLRKFAAIRRIMATLAFYSGILNSGYTLTCFCFLFYPFIAQSCVDIAPAPNSYGKWRTVPSMEAFCMRCASSGMPV
jgi:hypothetical protein